MSSEIPRLILKYLVNHQGHRRRHARRLFYVLAKRFTPVIASDVGPATYFVSTADDGIGWEVFLLGSFDREQTERAYRLLQRYGFGSLPGRTFVDIGANIGTNAITAVMERGFARAIAFEPGPRSFGLLQQNILVNGLSDRIRALQMALSEDDGELELELNPGSPGTDSIRAARPAAPGTGPAALVRAVRFDSLVESGELRVEELGLVWMDTQGHEAQVLAGAKHLLGSRVPVVAEFWPEGLAAAGRLDAFERLVAETYTHVVDVGKADADGGPLIPASEIGRVKTEYPVGSYTDLLLLKLD